MIERRFTDLSKLTYRIFTVKRKFHRTVNITILEWSGKFGIGSLGNDDGQFMRITTLAALGAWPAHGVVFDLRNLQYEWGDKIWEMFRRGMDLSGVETLPFATLISDQCYPGFATCMSIIEPVFDTIEAAVEDVARRAHDQLENLMADLDES